MANTNLQSAEAATTTLNVPEVQQVGNVKITMERDGAFTILVYKRLPGGGGEWKELQYRFKIGPDINDEAINDLIFDLKYMDSFSNEAIPAIVKILAQFPKSLCKALERCLWESISTHDENLEEPLAIFFKTAVTLPTFDSELNFQNYEFQRGIIKYGLSEAFTLLVQSQYFDPNINSILQEAIAQRRRGNDQFLNAILVHTKFDIQGHNLSNEDLDLLHEVYGTKPPKAQQAGNIEIIRQRNGVLTIRAIDDPFKFEFEFKIDPNGQSMDDITARLFAEVDREGMVAIASTLEQYPTSLCKVLEQCLSKASETSSSDIREQLTEFFKIATALPTFDLNSQKLHLCFRQPQFS